jgi:uncharacterized protein
MQFKVKDIGEDGVAVDLPVTDRWLETECPDLGAEPGPQGMRFRGRLERSGEDFLLRGNLRGNLRCPCARCLEPALLALDVEVAVIYSERDDRATEDDTLDAPDVLTFEDGVIDLGAELREEILLAQPVSVLCREDCAGLCPVCGGNRNTTPCDCEEKQRLASSKLGALGKLKV